MCDEFLKYHPRSNNYSDGLALCPRCNNGIALPLCNSCGKPMQEFDASLEELRANPVENDEPLPMSAKKKSWWE